MKCPVCGDRTGVEIDLHSEGFTGEEYPLKECGKCGAVWRIKRVKGKDEIDLVKPGKK